jgi:isoquinoline 1-oxidoreductase alpha subunit
MYSLNVNGKSYSVNVAGETPLLWVLRDVLGLTGTKYGCGIEVCGACTVLVDGQREKSCDMDTSSAAGKKIVTIEGLSPDRSHPAQKAWIEHQVPQCGYCQSGMIMAVTALLKSNPHPSDADLEAAVTNICRCGSYPRIRAAVHELSGQG